MTEPEKTMNEVIKGLMDNFRILEEEAEKRRKTASAKFENYKYEYAEGERHAYEEVIKQLKGTLK